MKTDIAVNPRVLLDLTRCFRRRHERGETGIDRVISAYYQHYKAVPQARFLVRFLGRVFVFDSRRIASVLALKPRERALTYLGLWYLCENKWRRLRGLRNYRYYNIGHSFYPEKFYKDLVKSGLGISIMIHDVIPLDYPQYCRADQIAPFEQQFKLWCRYADHIITPSRYSKARILYHSGGGVEIQVAPLAVTPPALPKNCQKENAFVVLGTIEPRKNHLMLLELWQDLTRTLGPSCPKLWIIGKRGWNNAAVFKILDHDPMMGQTVFEFGMLNDQETWAYLARAQALLFPSFVEGFGLPLYEANLAHIPVLASDIEAFQDLQDQSGVELINPNNTKMWRKAIISPKIYSRWLDISTAWIKHLELTNR